MTSLLAVTRILHRFGKLSQPPSLSLPRDNLGGEETLGLIAEEETIVHLKEGYSDDLTRSAGLAPHIENGRHAVFVLRGEPWAKRVSGVRVP